MTKIGYSQYKISDIGGGINTFNTPTEINDNQFTDVVNFHTGNGNLETDKVGSVAYSDVGGTVVGLQYSRGVDSTAVIRRNPTGFPGVDRLYFDNSPVVFPTAIYVNTIATSTTYTVNLGGTNKTFTTPSAPSPTIDQSQTGSNLDLTQNGTSSDIMANNITTSIAQTFIPSSNTLSTVVVSKIVDDYSTQITGDVRFDIYATSGGLPTTFIAGTVVPKDTWNTAPNGNFYVSISTSLTIGTTYALVITPQGNNGIISSNDRVRIRMNSGGYASGSLVTKSGGSWSANTSVDFYFYTYSVITGSYSTESSIIVGLWNSITGESITTPTLKNTGNITIGGNTYTFNLSYDSLYANGTNIDKWYIIARPISTSEPTIFANGNLSYTKSEITGTGFYTILFAPQNNKVGGSNYPVIILSGGGELFYFDGIMITKPLINFSGLIKAMHIFQSRLFLSVANSLYYAKPSSSLSPYALFDFSGYPASYQPIGENSDIVGFAENNDTFYIFTKNSSVFRVLGLVSNGINNNYYEVRKVSQNSTDSQRFIANVDKEIFYFDTYDKTVRRMYYEEYSQDLAGQDVGIPIRPSLALCTTTNGHLSYKYPYVKLRLTTTVENDTTYTYNVIDKSWTQQTSVVKFASYGKYTNYSDSAIYNDDSATTSRSGSANSKHYPMGNSVEYKRFGEFELYGNLASGSSFTFTLSLSSDGTTFHTYPITVSAGEFKKKFSIFMDAKSINVGLSYTNQSGLLQIYGYNVRYKIIPTFEIYS